jgi:hypothetical protein
LIIVTNNNRSEAPCLNRTITTNAEETSVSHGIPKTTQRCFLLPSFGASDLWFVNAVEEDGLAEIDEVSYEAKPKPKVIVLNVGEIAPVPAYGAHGLRSKKHRWMKEHVVSPQFGPNVPGIKWYSLRRPVDLREKPSLVVDVLNHPADTDNRWMVRQIAILSPKATR